MFEKEYWDENYSDPSSMDCLGNASVHAGYLKNLFDLEGVEIRSLIDLGFGYGHLFEAMVKKLRPEMAWGLEPSEYAFKKRNLRFPSETKVKLMNQDIQSWLASHPRSFDMGLCTSVFQYIASSELEKMIKQFSKKVRYLYLTVPTNKELKKQREELKFYDQYALSRSRSFYLKLLRPHFTFISSRLLESRHFYDEENTPFNEYLFRF